MRRGLGSKMERVADMMLGECIQDWKKIEKWYESYCMDEDC
jgi:hypothetical protein